MRALELLQLAKGTSRDEVTLNTEEIKPIALAIIELHLSEDLKGFWALLYMPNQCCHAVTK